jgi:hypothetical protein
LGFWRLRGMSMVGFPALGFMSMSSGPFCSISHGSTLSCESRIDPTIQRKFFVFWRGGCGRGAQRPPTVCEQSELIAS